jgi:hypothetical protein
VCVCVFVSRRLVDTFDSITFYLFISHFLRVNVFAGINALRPICEKFEIREKGYLVNEGLVNLKVQ